MNATEDEVRDRLQAVACAQFDVRRADVTANLAEAERVVRMAAKHGARLVVLPEMWTTSVCRAEEYTDELLAEAARAEERMREVGAELQLTVVGGGPARGEDGRLYNRAPVVEAGEPRGEYRKIHLFSPQGEGRAHSAGDEPLVVDTQVGRIGVAICYDLRFPELVRWYFHRGCELLVVPAQWPEARAAHWRILLKARAVENELFVVGCNRTGNDTDPIKSDTTVVFPGDSRIIDPMGEVLAAGEGEARPLVAELDMRKVRTMRRILPVSRDRRPALYESLWGRAWETRRPEA